MTRSTSATTNFPDSRRCRQGVLSGAFTRYLSLLRRCGQFIVRARAVPCVFCALALLDYVFRVLFDSHVFAGCHPVEFTHVIVRSAINICWSFEVFCCDGVRPQWCCSRAIFRGTRCLRSRLCGRLILVFGFVCLIYFSSSVRYLFPLRALFSLRALFPLRALCPLGTLSTFNTFSTLGASDTSDGSRILRCGYTSRLFFLDSVRLPWRWCAGATAYSVLKPVSEFRLSS